MQSNFMAVEHDEEDYKFKCPECEEPVDEDGEAYRCCHYAPSLCEVCDAATCDNSC